MSRDGSGVYSLPAGSTAVTGNTATAATHNTPIDDLALDANVARPIVAGGTGAATRAGARQGLYIDGNFVDKAATYTPLMADRSKVLRCTAALTLNLTEAATLADGWFIDVKADGGAVVIDPNGTELVDGVATITITDGTEARIVCTGSGFYSLFQPVASIANVVEDLTPQLGGPLDGQGNDITKLGTLSLTEQAAANADVAGDGQIWVKTATPNQLWFTDDAGNDVQLGAPAGGYTTDISLLYLYTAENKGDRLNMVGGIMDPFGDASDISVFTNLTKLNGKFVIAVVSPVIATPINMTSNVLPSPYVASKSDGATTAYELFDGTTAYEQTPLGGWAKIDLGSAVSINEYSITPGVNYTTYAWKTWTFEGSNDDVSWTVLDTQSDFIFPDGALVRFSCLAGSYRYLRWSPIASGVSGAYSQRLAAYLGTTTYPATLISNSFTASAVPTTCRLGVQATGALTINTDLIGYVSRDGGTTWATATLVLIDTLADGTKYYEDAAVSVATQPSGTAMQYKIVTASANWTSTDGVLLQWS